MTVLVITVIVGWLVFSTVLLTLICIAKSLDRQYYQSLLNEHGECQGCYMLRDNNMCTNPECRHFVAYTPISEVEVAMSRYYEWLKDPTVAVKMTDMLNDELPKIEPKEDDDGPGHTLYQ